MKYYLPLLFLLLYASSASAQPHRMPMIYPNQPLAIPGSHKDSVEFQKAFEELYPLIRSTPNVRERATAMLSGMGPVFRMRGIDSAKAVDTAMKAIDPNMDKEILFNAYRARFSAKELRGLVTFFKTPVGQHYLEVEGPIVFARMNEVQQRIAQTIYRALVPMMKAAQKNADQEVLSPHANTSVREPKEGEFVDVTNPPQPLVPIEQLVHYPESARHSGLEGNVTLDVLLGTDGRVIKVHVLRSDYDIFKSAAVDAIMKARFTPALANGTPVEVWTTQTIHFRLNPTPPSQQETPDNLLH